MTKTKTAIVTGVVVVLALVAASSLWIKHSEPPTADTSWPVGETRLIGNWKDRGGATPGATLETVLWAMTQNQPKKYFETYYNNPEAQIPGLDPAGVHG